MSYRKSPRHFSSQLCVRISTPISMFLKHLFRCSLEHNTPYKGTKTNIQKNLFLFQETRYEVRESSFSWWFSMASLILLRAELHSAMGFSYSDLPLCVPSCFPTTYVCRRRHRTEASAWEANCSLKCSFTGPTQRSATCSNLILNKLSWIRFDLFSQKGKYKYIW